MHDSSVLQGLPVWSKLALNVLQSPAWSWTHNPPTLASRVLELWMYSIIPSLYYSFKNHVVLIFAKFYQKMCLKRFPKILCMWRIILLQEHLHKQKGLFYCTVVIHLSRTQLNSNSGNKQVTDMENLQYPSQQVNTVHTVRAFTC